MKLEELVQAARAEKPASFGKQTDEQVAKQATMILKQLAKHIESAAPGVIKVPGLGRFVIRETKPKPGEVGKGQKRIMLRQARPKRARATSPAAAEAAGSRPRRSTRR